MQFVMTLNKLKQCRVCSDVAICFNFGGLCCEACKVFFRRSLVNNCNYKCLKKSNCLIDKWNRNSCKSCRLDKCFEIGMKKQLVEHFKEKLNSQTQIPPCVKENTNQLQEFDLKCIADIRKVTTTVFTESISHAPTGECSDLGMIVKPLAVYLDKTIKYCRQIEDFNAISPRDQLIMLKSFFPESCMLYASYIFSVTNDGLPVAMCDSSTETVFVKLELMSNLKKKDYYPKVFRKLAIPMNAAIENDSTIRDLLLIQSLFKPRIEIDCTDFVKYKHCFYSYLLWRYLKFKYRNMAELKFATLMCAVDELDRTSGVIREFFVHEVDKNYVEQILLELFNLL